MSRPPRLIVACVGLALGWGASVQAAPASSNRGAVSVRRPRVYDDVVQATVSPRDQAQVERLWQEAAHVLEPHDPIVAPHTLVLTRPALARLQRAGVEVKVDPRSVQELVDASYARNDQVLGAPGSVAAGAWFAKVQPLEAIETYLAQLVEQSAGRARVVTFGRSIQGRDMHALLVSSRPDDTTRASIIVTGAQHAREWLSPMVVMGIADGLVAGYATDARVKRVVDNLNVYIIPVMNPDGYLRTFNGNRLQRKNLRVGCNIDINRNFGTAFGQQVPNNCNAETTSGPSAFSEPESQALRALAEKQAKLRLYVDYHASGNQVMIPYAFTRDAPPGFAKNQQWGNLLATQAMLPARPAFNLAQGQGGGSLDWFREKYTDSLVVELPGRGFDPPANGVAANVDLQWRGWLAVAELVANENPADGAADAGVADAPMNAAGGPADRSGGAGGSTPGSQPGSGGSGGRTAEDAGSGGRTAEDAGPQLPSDAQEFAGLGCDMSGRGRSCDAAVLAASIFLGLTFGRRRRRTRRG